MRITRKENSWKILTPASADGCCLRELASRCGYRVCQMCESLDCSEGYFRRVFVRDTGLSPKRWLRDERMVIARQRLDQGWDPAGLAEELGFASLATFRREFRSVYGKVPAKWTGGGGK